MFNGLTRYVLRQLTVGMILVAAGLTCIIWLTQSLRFVEMIVNRGLSAGTFLHLTVLLVPNLLSMVLPIALFTVVMFAYSKMVTDREIVVMSAAGLSQWSLAKPAVIVSLGIVILSYALNLYFLPRSYQEFREFQWDLRHNYSHVLLQEGTFNDVSKSITVFVRQHADNGQLHGIMVHDTRDETKPATLMAERGAIVKAEDGPRVVMFNGNRQSIDTKTGQMSVLYFDRYTFDLQSTAKRTPDRYREPRERMVGELLNVEKDPMIQPKDRGKFIVEGHHRLASPWQALGFTMVALACLLSGDFSRKGQAKRIITAVAIIVLLEGLFLGLANITAKNLNLIPALYAANLLPTIIGFYVLVKRPAWKIKRFGGSPTAQGG